MPRPETAERRDQLRDKARKHKVSGRGLLTQPPNEERRKKKRRRKKKSSQ